MLNVAAGLSHRHVEQADTMNNGYAPFPPYRHYFEFRPPVNVRPPCFYYDPYLHPMMPQPVRYTNSYHVYSHPSPCYIEEVLGSPVESLSAPTGENKFEEEARTNSPSSASEASNTASSKTSIPSPIKASPASAKAPSIVISVEKTKIVIAHNPSESYNTFNCDSRSANHGEFSCTSPEREDPGEKSSKEASFPKKFKSGNNNVVSLPLVVGRAEAIGTGLTFDASNEERNSERAEESVFEDELAPPVNKKPRRSGRIAVTHAKQKELSEKDNDEDLKWKTKLFKKGFICQRAYCFCCKT